MQDNQRQTDLSYIAGVMDSDGCFMITRHKRKTQRKDYPHKVDNWSWTYMPSVKIQQIESQAVYFIRDDMKYGTITITRARKSRPNSQDLFSWGIRNRKEVKAFLEEIIPYLKIKKTRAQYLLDYCNQAMNIDDRGSRYFGLTKDELIYREESYQRMRELNCRKVAATTKPQGPEKACDSLIL
jgi:hypothetical protein